MDARCGSPTARATSAAVKPPGAGPRTTSPTLAFAATSHWPMAVAAAQDRTSAGVTTATRSADASAVSTAGVARRGRSQMTVAPPREPASIDRVEGGRIDVATCPTPLTARQFRDARAAPPAARPIRRGRPAGRGLTSANPVRLRCRRPARCRRPMDRGRPAADGWQRARVPWRTRTRRPRHGLR